VPVPGSCGPTARSASAAADFRQELVAQLRDLGVEPGDVLVVHTSFSKSGRSTVDRGLIAALQASIAPGGTLVMPSFSDDDDNPFDRARDVRGMGVVANTFWTLPASAQRQPARVRRRPGRAPRRSPPIIRRIFRTG
jgi:aminoglycoside N3'-acetyltransferase